IVLILVFVFFVVLAFRSLLIYQSLLHWAPSTLLLHGLDNVPHLLLLLPQPFQVLFIPRPLLSHFQDIPVSLVMFAGESEILLLETFRLLGHFLHLFPE